VVVGGRTVHVTVDFDAAKQMVVDYLRQDPDCGAYVEGYHGDGGVPVMSRYDIDLKTETWSSRTLRRPRAPEGEGYLK
jgi:hypothetical protein